MKPRDPSEIGDATPATTATSTAASTTRDDPDAETAEPQPQTERADQSTLDTARSSNLKIVAVGVGALLVLGALGLASTQNGFGAPPPTATQPPPAATNAPYVGTTQGCDSSFWAMPDHFSSWEEYVPDQRVGSLFGHAENYAEMSLADALGNQTSGEDSRRTLLREAVTAALNAANDSLAFPYARYEDGVDGRPPIVPTTNRLLTSGTNAEIVEFINDLSLANHLECPL